MGKIDYKKLVPSLIAPQLAGGIGTLFTSPAIPTWYAQLAKPSFNPPSWVFGPVWTTLFVLMGIACYLVWQKGADRPDVKKALWIFGIQLAANTLWSIIFFGMKNPGLAFAWIVLLWALIAWNIFEFKKFSRAAAWLLLPYISWVSFASVLNYAIWQLNR